MRAGRRRSAVSWVLLCAPSAAAVCDQDNLIGAVINRPATTFSGCQASMCIDGRTGGAQSCSSGDDMCHSADGGGSNVWLRLELPTSRTVCKVKIFNRQDVTGNLAKRLVPHEVWIGADGSDAVAAGNTRVATSSSAAAQVVHDGFDRVGKYVFIYLPGSARILNLWEVQVFSNPAPSSAPSVAPSMPPTVSPSSSPSVSPTAQPSHAPSVSPTNLPSVSPTEAPSVRPSSAPSKPPSLAPSATPTRPPSYSPSIPPTERPTRPPTFSPTLSPSAVPSKPPSRSPTKPPTQPPSRTPSVPPSGLPTPVPSTTPSRSPSMSPSMPPSGSPSRRPTAPPTRAPTDFPTGPPTRVPSSVPSESPTRRPTAPPTAEPSGPPSWPPTLPPQLPTLPPSLSPSGRPSGQPTDMPVPAPTTSPTGAPVPPTAPPSQAPTAGAPSAAPARMPTQAPTAAPAHPPSLTPTNGPTLSPTRFPHPHPSVSPSTPPTAGPTPPGASMQPSASPVEDCEAGEIRLPDMSCQECTPERVAGGCPAGGGGYAAPSADLASCICKCRFYWSGPECDVCPTGFGGMDCDRCALGGAVPPLCKMPMCADRTSIPASKVTHCGGGAQQLALRPVLRHKGIPASVTLRASSPSGVPQLSMPPDTPVRQLAGGGLAVEGAEEQLGEWLTLDIVPTADLTHLAPINISINISATGCHPVACTIVLTCPEPVPRVSGSLPAAVLPEGGSSSVPCPLPELAQAEPPLSVTTSPPGVLSYDPATMECTLTAAGLPHGAAAGFINVSVGDSKGAVVTLQAHFDVNGANCPASGHRDPMYLQLPPSGAMTNNIAVPMTHNYTTAELLGDPQGVSINLQEPAAGRLTVAAGSTATEGTVYVRLHFAVDGAECTLTQPLHLFWGPTWLNSIERIRTAVGRIFEHTIVTRAVSNTGSIPWCAEPTLTLAQSPPGISLRRRGVQWVLRGWLESAGIGLAYVAATDCRGGHSLLTVEIFGVVGTELGAPPEVVYLEDSNVSVPLPSVISTEEEVALSVAPLIDANNKLGRLSALCDDDVNITQPSDEDGVKALSMTFRGFPDQLNTCKLTLTPAPDVCHPLELVWWAEGESRRQAVRSLCAPDRPNARSKNWTARWGDPIDIDFKSMLWLPAGTCIDYHAARNSSRGWLNPGAADITGRAPRRESRTCQVVYGYACQTNLGSAAEFCAESLPDARVTNAQSVLQCREDTLCKLNGSMVITSTSIADNDTDLSMLLHSEPPVLDGLLFGSSPMRPEVHKTLSGELRVQGALGSIERHIIGAQLVPKKDFYGLVKISVRDTGGSAVAGGAPLVVFFAPVNDAPSCNKSSCTDLQLSCGLLSWEPLDLAKIFWDKEDKELVFLHHNSSSGVHIEGTQLVCASWWALADFVGFPISGTTDVAARDPSGAESALVPVTVNYTPTSTEGMTLTALCIVLGSGASVMSAIFVLFRPRFVARVRAALLSAAHFSPWPGELCCRVGRKAADALKQASGWGLSVRTAAGMHMLCANAEKLAARTAAEPGDSVTKAQITCGSVVLHTQLEGADDPAVAEPCAVVCPAQLRPGAGAVSAHISVMHADRKASLKLQLRLRQPGPEFQRPVFLSEKFSPARICKCCCTGANCSEMSGSARQLTEFGHMQRVVCPVAWCEAELIWTLSTANTGRDLLSGSIPVNPSGQPAPLRGSFSLPGAASRTSGSRGATPIPREDATLEAVLEEVQRLRAELRIAEQNASQAVQLAAFAQQMMQQQTRPQGRSPHPLLSPQQQSVPLQHTPTAGERRRRSAGSSAKGNSPLVVVPERVSPTEEQPAAGDSFSHRLSGRHRRVRPPPVVRGERRLSGSRRFSRSQALDADLQQLMARVSPRAAAGRGRSYGDFASSAEGEEHLLSSLLDPA
eukprot:TRINITY_DN5027_c2_g2_i3.p1 TRINITY_DN5027_c2_g2~~TRINITY_DN5027_c2_g2_i3.p1  ORF type:complete len:1896 (+),score=292.28 TRINITY_DN5027_c2_g2_i3:67-5754(+)